MFYAKTGNLQSLYDLIQQTFFLTWHQNSHAWCDKSAFSRSNSDTALATQPFNFCVLIILVFFLFLDKKKRGKIVGGGRFFVVFIFFACFGGLKLKVDHMLWILTSYREAKILGWFHFHRKEVNHFIIVYFYFKLLISESDYYLMLLRCPFPISQYWVWHLIAPSWCMKQRGSVVIAQETGFLTHTWDIWKEFSALSKAQSHLLWEKQMSGYLFLCVGLTKIICFL